MEFVGDKIKDILVYWDQATVLKQVGVMTARKWPVEDGKSQIEMAKRTNIVETTNYNSYKATPNISSPTKALNAKIDIFRTRSPEPEVNYEQESPSKLTRPVVTAHVYTSQQTYKPPKPNGKYASRENGESHFEFGDNSPTNSNSVLADKNTMQSKNSGFYRKDMNTNISFEHAAESPAVHQSYRSNSTHREYETHFKFEESPEKVAALKEKNENDGNRSIADDHMRRDMQKSWAMSDNSPTTTMFPNMTNRSAAAGGNLRVLTPSWDFLAG